MKSTSEITKMLLQELLDNIDKIGNIDNVIYYNEILGDTSFLLAGLLHTLIKKELQIDRTIWIDDSLISNIKLINKVVYIDGIMIWGKENTTEQWVDPFKFIMNLNSNSTDFANYYFFFKDEDSNEIAYEDFKENRNYYSYEIKSWKYEFNDGN